MKKTALILLFAIAITPSRAREKDDDLAYRAFEEGRAAFSVADYAKACAPFERG